VLHVEAEAREDAGELAAQVLELAGLHGESPLDADMAYSAMMGLGLEQRRAVAEAWERAGDAPGRAAAKAARLAARSPQARCVVLAALSVAPFDVRWHPKAQLKQHFQNDPRGGPGHQGVVLETAALVPWDALPALEAMLQGGGRPVGVVLDGVTDPQNLGAIARSAAFFGARALVLSARNCAPPSPAASKASAGALELLAAGGGLLTADRTHRVLASARELGWAVVGAAGAEQASASPGGAGRISQGELGALGPTLLVVGSESAGLRHVVREQCDGVVGVEGAPGRHAALDSLNVSTATALLLQSLCSGGV